MTHPSIDFTNSLIHLFSTYYIIITIILLKLYINIYPSSSFTIIIVVSILIQYYIVIPTLILILLLKVIYTNILKLLQSIIIQSIHLYTLFLPLTYIFSYKSFPSLHLLLITYSWNLLLNQHLCYCWSLALLLL